MLTPELLSELVELGLLLWYDAKSLLYHQLPNVYIKANQMCGFSAKWKWKINQCWNLGGFCFFLHAKSSNWKHILIFWNFRNVGSGYHFPCAYMYLNSMPCSTSSWKPFMWATPVPDACPFKYKWSAMCIPATYIFAVLSLKKNNPAPLKSMFVTYFYYTPDHLKISVQRPCAADFYILQILPVNREITFGACFSLALSPTPSNGIYDHTFKSLQLQGIQSICPLPSLHYSWRTNLNT